VLVWLIYALWGSGVGVRDLDWRWCRRRGSGGDTRREGAMMARVAEGERLYAEAYPEPALA